MKLFSRGKQKSGKPIGKNASGKSSTKPNAKPTPKSSSKPAAKASSKPATKSTSKPATKVASGSAPKKPAQKVAPATKQPTSKPTATTASNKPKSTPTSKPAQKSITTPANKPVSKASPRASAPSSAKPQTKSVSKPNVSKIVPKGRTVQTRDEYIQGGYTKPGYENKGNYRKGVVVETNELDELAIVAATTSPKGKKISNYDDKATYKPYILTKDDEGKPIKTGSKFVPNKSKDDVPLSAVTEILKDCNDYEDNRKKIRDLKRRTKTKK